jgi:hypothetical protein
MKTSFESDANWYELRDGHQDWVWTPVDNLAFNRERVARAILARTPFY